MTNREAADWLSRIKDKYIHGGDESYDNSRKEAIDHSIAQLHNIDQLLSLCDQCEEYNGQTHIHIEDVRWILRGTDNKMSRKLSRIVILNKLKEIAKQAESELSCVEYGAIQTAILFIEYRLQLNLEHENEDDLEG